MLVSGRVNKSNSLDSLGVLYLKPLNVGARVELTQKGRDAEKNSGGVYKSKGVQGILIFTYIYIYMQHIVSIYIYIYVSIR